MSVWRGGIENRKAYLESVGIDPSEVFEDGITEEGYFSPVYYGDEHRNKVRDASGDSVKVWHTWPDGVWAGFNAAWSRDIAWEEVK